MVLTIKTPEEIDTSAYERFVDFIENPNPEEQFYSEELPDFDYFVREGVRSYFLGEDLDTEMLESLDEKSLMIFSYLSESAGILIKNVYNNSFQICHAAMETEPNQCLQDLEKQRYNFIDLLSHIISTHELEALMTKLGIIERRRFIQTNSWE